MTYLDVLGFDYKIILCTNDEELTFKIRKLQLFASLSNLNSSQYDY